MIPSSRLRFLDVLRKYFRKKAKMMKRNTIGIKNSGFIIAVTTMEPTPMRTTCTASKRHFASHSSMAPKHKKDIQLNMAILLDINSYPNLY